MKFTRSLSQTKHLVLALLAAVADPGVVLCYGLPKAAKRMAAQAPQFVQRIPVGAMGK